MTYRYRDAINGFFEFPTEDARAILPAGLQPVESHHASSILAVTGFEFQESPAGAYREVTLSIVVAPRIAPGTPMPRAALYPFQVGTTTRESRLHGMQQWRLPHLDAEIDVQIERPDGKIRLTAREGGRDVLELTVTDDGSIAWEPVEHHYQTFMKDEAGSYLSSLVMKGPFMEHEAERGHLVLHSHPFTAALDPASITTIPFREQWMKDGLETIYPLQILGAATGK